MLNEQYLTDNFAPAVIEAMLAAFRMACDAPQLRFTADARTLMIAEKILDLALVGETDAERLCAGALRRLSH